MTPPAAVGIHNDLTARQTRVALRPAHNETAGRVDQIFGLLVQHRSRKDLLDHLFDEKLLDFRVLHVGRVLRRDHDVHHFHRLVVLIANRHLRLGVRPQPVHLAALANLRQLTPQPVREHDRRRHQLRRLAARVTKHDPLVARPLLRRLLSFRLLRIHALRDVRRLARQVIVDEHLIGVKHIVAVHVADVANRRAHDRLVVQLRLRRDLPREDHHVRLHHRLAGDSAEPVLSETGIEHAVGNQVSDLVRMAFADGFGGKNE